MPPANNKNGSFVIVGHIANPGGFLFETVDYLRVNSAYTVFIGHPLNNEPGGRSFYQSYKSGQLFKEVTIPRYRLPNPLRFLQDIIITWWWLGKEKRFFDLFIGVDILNAFAGVGLRMLKRVRHLVLWTIDYVPKRFPNGILNEIYHGIDRFCLTYCDYIWNMSPRMAEGRYKTRGLHPNRYSPQIVVPHGIHLRNFQERKNDNFDRYAIVFMGHIFEKSGVQLVVEALPLIRKFLPKIHLLIIGSGPYESKLRLKVSELGLEGCVEFTGYIEDHQIIEDYLAQCAVGVAIYYPAKDDFTYYADPGKVKTYLGAGLPVIITDVPWIARDLNEKKCGVITRYNVNDLVNSLVYLLGDEDRLREYRINALHYAENFEYSQVLDRALTQTLGTDWHSVNDETSD